MRHRLLRSGAAAVLATLCLGGGPASANVFQGTVIGVFGGPVVVAGNVLHDPNIFSTTYFDNTGTAVYRITNSTDPAQAGTPPLQATGSQLAWGDDNSGTGEQSLLNFFGAPIPANINQSFRLGRITYQNGTSNLGSLIFGATISFYDNSVSPVNFLGTDTIIINTTSNLGADPSQDADYINICGNQSNICNTSIDAIEISQGGTGVTVDLYGVIVGDPQLFITFAQLAPGQSTATNGFLGTDLPLAVPEPATLALFGGALGGLLALRRRAQG